MHQILETPTLEGYPGVRRDTRGGLSFNTTSLQTTVARRGLGHFGFGLRIQTFDARVSIRGSLTH